MLEWSRSICCCSDSEKGKPFSDSFNSTGRPSTLHVDNVTRSTKECRAVPDSLGPSHKAARFLCSGSEESPETGIMHRWHCEMNMHHTMDRRYSQA